MDILKLIVNIIGVCAGVLSGIWWIRSALAKVPGKGNVGVGWGGVPVNVKNDKGEVIDFLETYALQSRWNSLAALASAVSAICFAILFVMTAK